MESSIYTGFVFDERFLAHDTGMLTTVEMRGKTFEISPDVHPSANSITRRTKEFFDGSGLTALLRPIPARSANEDELARFHTRAYIAGIRAYAEGGPARGPWGEADVDTVVSPGSFEAALYAAGGAMNAVSAVLEGRVRNAYALLRPPCHHATRNQALGFCIFNNTVLAAQHARQVYGLERIMILDWDAHHGNGTQEAFYEDNGVLFLSLHQHNWFPKGGGELEQSGSGVGTGYSVNIPLPPGTGDRGYFTAFEQLVLPIATQFRPQLVIVTAGQDACWMDPMTRLMLTMDGYRSLSQRIVHFAEQACDGRLVLLQAGGYSLSYAPYCTAAVVEPLLDVDLGIVDLNADSSEVECCKTIFTQDTQYALEAARAWHRRWWDI